MKLYDMFNVLSGFALLLFNFSCISREEKQQGLLTLEISERICKKRSTAKKCLSKDHAALWCAAEMLLLTAAAYLPAPTVNTLMGDLLKTRVNYYGMLVTAPLILFLCSVLLKTDPMKQIDMVTPGFPLALCVAKIGCYTAGCCGGVTGIMDVANPFTGEVGFPIQLVESAMALVLFVILLRVRKRIKPGCLYPLYMVLYSAQRFFTEFLRQEPNVFFVFKTYHFVCAAGVFFGLFEYLLAKECGQRLTNKLQEKWQAVGEKTGN